MSSRVRRWLRSIALVLGVLVVVFALFHDTFYRWVALQALQRVAGVNSNIDGKIDVSLGSPLLVNLSGLRVALAGRDLEGPRGSIGSLHFELRLLPLLSGVVKVKSLDIRDAEIELFTLDLSHLLGSGGGVPVPLVEHWTLENVRVGFRLTESGARNELLVTRLAQGPASDGSRTMQGSGSLDGDAWALDGELGPLEELLNPTRPFPISMAIQVPDWGLKVDARGSVGVPLRGEDLQLELKAGTSDLSPMLGRLLPGTPFAGALAATARLSGSLKDPLLSDLSVGLDDGERIQVNLQGSAPLSLAGAGLDLAVRLGTGTPEVARYLTRDRVPGVERLQMTFTARTGGGGYLLEEVSAAVAAGEGHEATYEGTFRITPRDGTWRVGDIAGTLAADVAIGSLSDWLPDDYPSRGDINGKATLRGDETRLSVPSFDIRLSGDGPLQGSLQGEAQLLPAALRRPRPATDGPVPARVLGALSARIDLETANVHELGKAIGVPLPDLGTGQVKAAIQLHKGQYQVTGLDASTRSRDGMKGAAQGSMSFGAVSRERLAPTEVKLQVDFGGPNVAAAKPLGVTLGVDTGPWTIQAHVHGEKGKLKVDRFTLKAGAGEPLRFEANGRGGSLPRWLAWDLENMENAFMQGRLQLADIRSLENILDTKIPDVGRLDASFEARSGPSGWAIPRLVARIEDDRGVRIDFSGAAEGIPVSPRFHADVELDASSSSAAAALTGGALSGGVGLKSSGKLDGALRKATYKGNVVLGSTTVKVDLAVDMSGARPMLEGSLTTTAMNGADLGWPLKITTPDADGRSSRSPAVVPSLISTEPFDFSGLALMDFDLDIRADAVQANGAGITALKLKARNQDRRLHLAVEDLRIARGQLTGTLDLDARSERPKISISSKSSNLSLHDIHGWLDEPGERMSGRLSIELQLEGSGRSLKELMAGANGRAREVILDGQLLGGDLDLLDMRAMHLLLSMAAPSERTAVECAIAEFELVDGVATARKLFVQTPKMRVAGTGTLNFRDETVDLLLRAQRRRLKLFSLESTIEVKGSMAALKVEADVNALAAGTALTAGVVVSPVLAPIAGLGLLTDLLGGQGESACKEMGATSR